MLAAQASPGLRRATREAIHLVDASSIRLTEISRAWANYQAHGALVKLHLDFDADCAIPANFAITPARVNDVSMAHALPIERGATYIFDLGYYDFSWWAKLHEAGCRIVTRLKTHTRPRVLETRAVAAGGPLGFLLHASGADNLIDAAYRYARHEPGIDVVLFGTGSLDHLRANIASILRPPLPAADVARLNATFAHLVGVGLDLPDRVK